MSAAMNNWVKAKTAKAGWWMTELIDILNNLNEYLQIVSEKNSIDHTK
jgi:hypothetical protein